MAKWLDKYEQGGLVLKKKTKDNYGKQSNYNDAKASVGPDFVGLGYNTKGRDYSPAWRGQFQDGGILGKTFLQPNSSKLPAAPTPGGKKGQMSTELAMSIGGEGGQPGYLIPTFKHGKPLADPEAEFRQTGEHLGGPFKTWQAAEKWGKERHKFVEKGQSVPSPTKTWDEFAMGGGIPGAVGFTYARTAGSAPANGKYTKKTKASAQDGGLFSTNTQAAQDATRNVIPRKMTAQEKKEAEEASKKAIAAGKARDEKIIEERKKNTSTKGDINTPGSWHTADKLRMFPENVGGLGEMYDEYINPAMMVGSLADAVGESVAARSPEGVAISLGMAAGMGALGMDPLGTALKYKNVGSNYLKNLQQRGAIVQTAGGMPVKPSTRFQEAANIAAERTRIPSQPPTGYGGISQAEIDRYMQNVDIPSAPPSQAIANQERTAAIRQQNTPRTPYQAPTDDEILRMNEAEANRYYRRPTSTDYQPGSYTPDYAPVNRPPVDRDAEMARFRQRLAESNARDAQRQSNVYEQLVSEDDLVDRAVSSAPPRPVEAGPNWGDKEFKLGQAKPGFNRYTDDKGNSFVQDVTQLDDELFGEYTISNNSGGYMKLKTKIDKDQQGYLKVRDMTFRSEDEKISDGQFKKIMAHLPPKVEMGYISTSMYSQPLMDAQVARWANNQPGRIELQDIHLGELNTWNKNHADAIYDANTGEKYGDYFEQLKRQFPRIQKTAKSIANATGYEIPEPKLKLYDRSRNVPEYIEVPFEDLKTQQWKDYIEQNPQVKSEFKIFAPKYNVKKNWKNGGNIVDPMGQWVHPGEVTTIPSNDITMKGVNYDVLGVSNTGDKKLMKPGKNYKFDGDSVTEYPKGGWLNKYK